VHQFQLGLIQRLADRSQVDRLAASHAAGAAGVSEQGNHFELPTRLVEWLAGEKLESQRLQAVADQQGGWFVEFNMAGRAAATQHVVVHARQVVMNQRIGVDQFDRAADDVEVFRRGAGQLASSVGEQRAHAFAATQCGVAHGVMQAGGNAVIAGQMAGEGGFGAVLRDGHPFGKRRSLTEPPGYCGRRP
jgi:hypothetical protein